MHQERTLLLINPWVLDFAAYDLFFKPYGLLLLAANLAKAGYRVLYLDCMDRYDPFFIRKGWVWEKKYGTGKFHSESMEKPPLLRSIPRIYKRYGLPFTEVGKRLLELSHSGVDAVLITSLMTYWYPGVFDMIGLVKEHLKNTPVILGGLYVNLMYDHALAHSGADHVVKGEGIASLVHEIALRLGHPLIGPALHYEEEPLYDLYGKLSYLVLTLTSGCPYHCSYCASPLLHPHYRIKDLSLVYERAREHIKKFRIRDIAFYDDALLYNFKDVLKKFLDLFPDKRYNFHTPNGLHLRYINEEVAEYLHGYNFKTLRLSLETADPSRQRSTGPKVTNKEFIQAVKNLSRAGFRQKEMEVYIMAGFPDQNMKELKRSIDFIKDNGAAPKIVEYSLIPGTRDYQRFFHTQFIDPLLHNNSIFFSKFSRFSYEDLSYLREYGKT